METGSSEAMGQRGKKQDWADQRQTRKPVYLSRDMGEQKESMGSVEIPDIA
jgi:hypothetical protein